MSTWEKIFISRWVIQGHIVHNWKARWFVLTPDKLLYYKYKEGKRDSCQRGKILLKDCLITCPFLEYENRLVSCCLHDFCEIKYAHKPNTWNDNDSIKSIVPFYSGHQDFLSSSFIKGARAQPLKHLNFCKAAITAFYFEIKDTKHIKKIIILIRIRVLPNGICLVR